MAEVWGYHTDLNPEDDRVRVSTAFNRLLQIPGAWVTDVVIGDGDVEVTLRPRARLLLPVRDAVLGGL